MLRYMNLVSLFGLSNVRSNLGLVCLQWLLANTFLTTHRIQFRCKRGNLSVHFNLDAKHLRFLMYTYFVANYSIFSVAPAQRRTDKQTCQNISKDSLYLSESLPMMWLRYETSRHKYGGCVQKTNAFSGVQHSLTITFYRAGSLCKR